VVDPHKGLFTPYGVGAVLVKDQQFLKLAMNPSAPYLDEALKVIGISPIEYSFELTKHNRSPRLKLCLDMYGEEIFSVALDEKLILAQYLYEQLKLMPKVILNQRPQLSIVAFRLANNDLTSKLLERLND